MNKVNKFIKNTLHINAIINSKCSQIDKQYHILLMVYQLYNCEFIKYTALGTLFCLNI